MKNKQYLILLEVRFIYTLHTSLQRKNISAVIPCFFDFAYIIIIFQFFKRIYFYFRYKDNKPYPWPSESSSFILYPDAANQTIYTRSITAADKGNYSCRLRNDTHLSTNNVNLEIFGK